MANPFVPLAIAMLVAALAPYLASLVPGHAVPEVVFLVFGGAVLGPYLLGVLDVSAPTTQLVSELGLGLLFLNAGYEVDVHELAGRMGLHATLAWCCSLALGVVVAYGPLAQRFPGQAGLAFAICLTTTAYGTLAPILRDRGLGPTRVGHVVQVYGATGELLPILAMSLLLSTHGARTTVLQLVGFVAVCAAILVLPRIFPRGTRRAVGFLRENAWSGSQPLLRAAMLLLVVLLMVASLLSLDVVLGAFVAGFILRAFVPEETGIARALQEVGNGFLTPVYFVISGARVSLPAALSDLGLLCGFIVLLVLVRGVVVAVSLQVNPQTRDMPATEKFSAAAYCTMALPLVVAVTTSAVSSGAMLPSTASVLVTAGAVTVLLIPVLTSFVRVSTEAHPVEAVREVASEGRELREVLADHRGALEAGERRYERAVREHEHAGHALNSAEYLARGVAPTDKGDVGADDGVATAAGDGKKSPDEGAGSRGA